MDTILLRCQSCGSVNRVAKDKIALHPRCGTCKALLRYPESPVAVTSDTYQDEVIAHPGTKTTGPFPMFNKCRGGIAVKDALWLIEPVQGQGYAK